MAEYRNRHDIDQFGLDVQEGLGFSFNRSGVREFIRADRKGVVTHRLFIYTNGDSPGQIALDEGEAITELPLITQVWQELGNAPERRGLGAIPRTRREKATSGGGGASGGAGGGGGGASGGAGGAGGGGDGGRRLGRWISRSAVGADGSPALAEDSRHRYRNRTRKNKQK